MQENKPIVASIQPNFIGKRDEYKKRSKYGWKNVELTHKEFKDCLDKGYAHGHQWHEGTRLSNNFIASTVISVDFDKGNIKLDKLLANSFIQKTASFVYTSSSHSDENHRFHVLFVLPIKTVSIEDLKIINQGFYKKISDSFNFANHKEIVDTSVDNPASFLFGSPKSLKLSQDILLTYEQMDEIRRLGISAFKAAEINVNVTTLKKKHLDPQLRVQLPNSKYASLDTLNLKAKIRCPFHKPDAHASAFVIESANHIRGIHCRTCRQSWFTGPTPPEKYNFFKVDDLIRENSNKVNKNYEYQGLAKIFPELESDPFQFNYQISTQQYLESIPTKKGIHLIKSPKGSGKTTALIKLIEEAKFNPTLFGAKKDKRVPIILIGHRQALIKEMSEKLGLTCYLDTGNYDSYLAAVDVHGKIKYVSQKPSEYSICLDSLQSRMRLDVEHYPIVIIDESEQVFSHLLSDSMKRPSKNFDVLSQLIGRASHVYCLDADLGEVSVDGVLNCLQRNKGEFSGDYINHLGSIEHQGDIFFHLNEYKAPSRNIGLISDKFEIFGNIVTSIKNNKKCYVATNSKKIAESLHLAISKMFPGKKFLCVTSNNSGDEDIRQHMRDIKSTVLGFDAIFSSPSLGTGIDITYADNVEVVDCVYGIFLNGINTHFDIDQQIARVRHPKEVNVWIEAKNTEHITFSQIIHQDLLDEYDVPSEVKEIDQNGITYSISKTPFINLLTKIRQIRYESQNNFRENFIAYKDWQGWSIKEALFSEQLHEIGKKLHKSGIEQFKAQYHENLLSAKIISSSEYHNLEEKRQKNDPKNQITSEDRILIEKYWLDKIYKCEITNEILKLDNYGAFRKAVRIFEALTHNKFDLIKSKRDINQFMISNFDSLSGNSEKINEQAFALKKAYEAAGIFKDGKFVMNATWSQQSLSNFISLCKDDYYRAEISRLFDMDIGQKNLSNRASRQLTEFLKLAGLKGLQITRNRGAGNSFSSYSICPERMALINEIVARRLVINSSLRVSRAAPEDEEDVEF